MQQMVDEAGNIWNVDAQGNPVSFAGSANQQRGGGMQIKPADPTQQYAGPNAAADLRGQQLANEQKAQELANAQRGDLPKGYRWGADGRAELIPGVPAPGAKSEDSMRLANIRAAIDQLNHVESLFNENQKGVGLGSILEYLPTQGNKAFDSAGAGLADIGLAAFKVPGVGSQSDADAARFVQANQPSRWDNDAEVKEKLGTLRRRIDSTLQAMGQAPAQWGAQFAPGAAPVAEERQQAAALPRAAGAQADPGLAPNGVTPQGGFKFVEGLRGVDQAVVDMIGKGASAADVVGFLNQAYEATQAEHGGKLRVGPDLAAWVGQRVEEHRANPGVPVRSLGQGWEILGGYEDPGPPSIMGRIADTTLGNFTMNAANAATAGLPAYLAGDQGAAVMQAASLERPGSSLAGEVAGGVAALSGINGLAGQAGRVGSLLTRGGGIGGDMAYGATRGGLEGGPGGALGGALAAGVGNKVGSGIVNTTGRAVRGVSDPAVRALADRDIRMSLGSLLGNRSIAGKMINRLESAPIVGDMFAARRADSIEDFNREAFKDAVAPVGGTVTKPGREGMGQALGIIDEGYKNALGDVAIDAADPGFLDEINAARSNMGEIPTVGSELGYNFDKQVAPLYQGGTLSGQQLQAALKTMREMRSGYAGSPMGKVAGDAISQAEEAMRGVVGRQRPDVMPKLDSANEAYRNVSTLADAVNTAANTKGIFTPAQLGRSSVSNTKKYGGKMKAAKGDVPFATMQEAAQEVLPSAYPDSGTAGRLLSAALPTALGGGAVTVGQLGSPELAVPLALLAALSSKTGSKVAQKALTGRSTTARAAGRKIIQQRRKAGLFGSATGVSMLPQLSQ